MYINWKGRLLGNTFDSIATGGPKRCFHCGVIVEVKLSAPKIDQQMTTCSI
jgi:hypothetical protein